MPSVNLFRRFARRRYRYGRLLGLVLTTVEETDIHATCAVDDVLVGDDVTVGSDDESGSGGRRGAGKGAGEGALHTCPHASWQPEARGHRLDPDEDDGGANGVSHRRERVAEL